MTSILNSLDPRYVLLFGGQGSAWRRALDESLALPHQGEQIRMAFDSAMTLLSPIALELLSAAPGASDRLGEILAGGSADSESDSDPAVSGPGILLAQLGALIDLDAAGLNLHERQPQAILGHSQGLLGARLATAFIDEDEQASHEVIALAILIGSAAQKVSGRIGATPRRSTTPMLAVRGLDSALVSSLIEKIDDVSVAVVNGPDTLVLSGLPKALDEARQALEKTTAVKNKELEERLHGGSPLSLSFDALPVAAPFHSELLNPALALVDEWVERINAAGKTLDAAAAHDLAARILVHPGDWVGEINALLTKGARVLLDLGPTAMVGRLSAPLLAGTSAQVVDASTRAARTALDVPGSHLDEPVSWESFAPRLVRLPDGRRLVDTAFTRLTGKSPILLPGMTPTTVSPEIVAAAANAGHWAEMAGGGQYSEEVFTENRTGLEKLLAPGRTAGFNTMFFDRFMWNLQFGVTKIVPKARRAGSPIDAVTIAAGIPEAEEARELITQLRADGFEYLCLKPGTVEQIHQALNIAEENPEVQLILQVEDGHSGGHHSWENLDDLLLATYAQIRATPNVVLAVGGGIGRPEDAVSYITGEWSRAHGRPLMPVDAVLVGTAAMATLEARTSPQVKRLLVETPGVDGDGWVGRGKVRGGMTSGLSHLDADMHEIENSSAVASRLIHELGGDLEAIEARRDEVIAALAKTAKPYFGDLEDMTYAQWASRVVELSFPYADWTWADRVLDLFHRIEARLSPLDHGEFETLFADVDAIEDAPAALERLLEAYPQATRATVAPSDAEWFPSLCRKHHKPMPFVPALDADLARWWGTDTLWQAQDPRFDADSVRIIPGPRSVAGITRVDEPVGELFGRFENALVDALAEAGAPESEVWSRFHDATDLESFVREIPFIQWAGTLVANPAKAMPGQTTISVDDKGLASIEVTCETAWDGLGEEAPHAVRRIDIPILTSEACRTGGVPVVDMERLSISAYDLLAGAAGVGTVTVNGDRIDAMPAVEAGEGFGLVRDSFTLSADLGPAHGAVTGAALRAELAQIVPDALVGPCWPAIYTALGSAIHDGVPVIEGLVNAVHLDHTIRFDAELPAAGSRIEVEGRCAELSESSAGRVVRVELELFFEGVRFARLTERFAIRGRVASTQPPSGAPSISSGIGLADTPRSFIRRATIVAPADMTAFANVSGDFNPIHTSAAAAGLSGLSAPLVHGMWLSACAQHLIEAEGASPLDAPARDSVIRSIPTPHLEIEAWSYQMHGMVNLRDRVEITIERVGRAGGRLLLEATCRVNGDVVSIGTALVKAPASAYVYPGQGIQRQGMGMESMTPAIREVWERADRATRERLGFSIRAIVADNPTQIRIGSQVLRHPEGVLNLTQFTQVALATLAYAQTADLKAQGAFVEGSYYAGHSLGEYNALAACAQIFPFEKVLEIVYQRGSAMHNLVERDAQGRSNYRMGALRPNQFGVTDEGVRAYVESVAEKTGEFLQIVNYNLADSQYAVAGTIAGLDALAADADERAAEFGGRRPFMLIPGIDVPFHSIKLRAGVAPFRERLEALIPEDVDLEALEGRYIPNLVARPFEVSREFAESILEVVPSESVQALLADWEGARADRGRTARTLLVELLAWQFASPVRWIETQDLLLNADRLGVERVIEIGLGTSPTLANLASKTLSMPAYAGRTVEVFNLERDSARILATDTVSAPVDAEAPAPTGEAPAPATDSSPDTSSAPSTPATAEAPAPAAAGAADEAKAQAPAAGAVDAAQVPDMPLSASEAVKILLAHGTKIRVEQIDASDTIDSLTNGVSSKRNQLLMDMAAELSIPSIEGGAEAPMSALMASIDQAAPTYAAFGPVLSEAISSRLRVLLGGAGLKAAHVSKRVTGHWQLGQGWAQRVSARILLDTREGDSVRGGALASLPPAPASASEVDALVDAAVGAEADALGIAIAAPGTGGGASGELVDSAALTALTERILGSDGLLATQARSLLAALGHEEAEAPGAGEDLSALAAAVDAELGVRWLDSVRPAFTPERAVLFDDRWALAREDLARAAAGEFDVCTLSLHAFRAGGSDLADLAKWYAQHAEGEKRLAFENIAKAALEEADDEFAGDIALVTGAAPKSIAAAVVERLLAGGASVIMTSSRINDARLAFAKELYRAHASIGAKLWLVPANMASLRDIDALTEWISSDYSETSGASSTLVKPALLPTLLIPFAAPPVSGTLGSDPHGAMAQERLLLWSVERTIAKLAALDASTAIDHRLHVLLPGSPNRGIFGGDGAYAEAKASFDTICTKWSNERGWPERVTLAHPRIGWVKGTTLMGGNDLLVPAAEAAGVHVYTSEEIATSLVELLSHKTRQEAALAPVDMDLTGGLSDAGLDLPALAAAERARAAANSAPASKDAKATLSALPNLVTPVLADRLEWNEVEAGLDEQIVIVGVGEVSAWGSGRTRHEAEHSSADVELSAAGVLELAWMMGLLHWADSPAPGWYDSEDKPVEEAAVYERFHDEVVARCGIRPLDDDGFLIEGGSDDAATVFLASDQEFTVDSQEDAQAYFAADPARTKVVRDESSGEWKVRKLAGSAIRVPRRATLTRSVAGQIPADFDPAKWGIPASMIEALDRIAVWNLVTAVDAFVSAGFTPMELLQAVHPADVSSTQGTGIGGMESLRKVFLSRFLGEDRPQDILQEALPNVVAAHTMQSYIGGYGQMIHPVGACATAAVSIEEACDKISLGKSDFVVAGGIDDIGVESLTGFGDMNATAESAALYARGISPRRFSRAGDRRRAGFLEAAGGGTVLLTRASIAADMGLPVLGVIAYARSFADGAHTSIPAPGIGAMAAARGGVDSGYARALARLGLCADDVAVVSKHDTSTKANDPNEAELHATLSRALGRTPGNPLHVISQKTITGHAKGGAALFQTAGLTEVFRDQQIPGNAALDCLDPQMREFAPLVWLRTPLNLEATPVRAGVLTSLGFGHVSALVALAHPSAFETRLAAERGEDAAAAWRETASRRLREGRARLEGAMIGREPLFEPIEGRRLPESQAHAVEEALLLDPDARLGASGVYGTRA
ncbi:polyketide synthase [Schaalia cardiffensis]|uniref:polyketide synthase n=1 Tax=Schaalia cardiffensis TaxID=181487 RepID=UPI002AB07FE9|nr:polyketide synthase [Schaalia cardiffensis]